MRICDASPFSSSACEIPSVQYHNSLTQCSSRNMTRGSTKPPKKTQAASKKPNLCPRTNLPTPEPSPAVETGRVAADEARKAAEANSKASEEEEPEDPKKELERILGCADDAHVEILGVEPNASEDDVLAAWRHLGCLLHPKYCQLEKAKDAFQSKSWSNWDRRGY
jgi:hypothetical protein